MSGGPFLGITDENYYYMGIVSYGHKVSFPLKPSYTISGANLFSDVRKFISKLIDADNNGDLNSYLSHIKDLGLSRFLILEEISLPLKHYFKHPSTINLDFLFFDK